MESPGEIRTVCERMIDFLNINLIDFVDKNMIPSASRSDEIYFLNVHNGGGGIILSLRPKLT